MNQRYGFRRTKTTRKESEQSFSLLFHTIESITPSGDNYRMVPETHDRTIPTHLCLMAPDRHQELRLSAARLSRMSATFLKIQKLVDVISDKQRYLSGQRHGSMKIGNNIFYACCFLFSLAHTISRSRQLFPCWCGLRQKYNMCALLCWQTCFFDSLQVRTCKQYNR